MLHSVSPMTRSFRFCASRDANFEFVALRIRTAVDRYNAISVRPRNLRDGAL